MQKWGQNWGIPLYRWAGMERDGFRWWRRRIRKSHVRPPGGVAMTRQHAAGQHYE